ncbi:MAG: TonB family protein [Myxococcales bacterium]|nr:TonB family protein [Myxococcales bacterium]
MSFLSRLSGLLLLLAAGPAAADPPSRSPFASWSADVAAPSRVGAAPWFCRTVIGPADGGRVDLARPLHAALDRSGPLVGADLAHADGASGRGTLVAIIDSGVDFSHPAFLDAAGRPRIVWYLDLTLPSRGPAGWLDDRGGALFDRDDLARALRDPAAPRPSPDVTGHGTRVASIAAGNDPAAPGIAPAAELLVVRADRLPGGRYDEADVADAVAFAFDAAETLGRPCVVNLSLGGQAGAHDGSSWLEQSIDAALSSGPAGRAVVVAAGNDGDGAVHARLAARSDAPARVTLVVPGNAPLPGAPAAVVLLDLWSHSGRPFSLTVELPDASRHLLAPSDPPLELALDDGASLRLEPPVIDDRGRTEALLALVGGTSGAIPPGRYSLEVEGHATIEAWLTSEAQTTLLPVRLEGPLVSDTTLSIPATARTAIAVASVATRSSWTNHLGEWVDAGPVALGVASSFTGRGPTADGRFKPDLAAPGEWILAAHSSAADWPLVAGAVAGTGSDARHSAGRGTSLAAPHVTGAVALLLEREPGLRAPEIAARLRAAAAGEGLWNEATGFGRLDVPALLAPLPSPPAGSRVALSLARPVLPPDGPRSTEVALLRRDEDAPVAARDCSLRWPATLAVSPSFFGAAWIGRIEASRLAPGECAEIAAVTSGEAPAARAAVCVAPDSAPGCAVPAPRSIRIGPWLTCLCLLALHAGARGRRLRPWFFAAASVAVHLLFLALLAWWLPTRQPPLRSSPIAAGIVADLERPEPPPARPAVAPVASPPPPQPIAMDRLSPLEKPATPRSPAPARSRRPAVSPATMRNPAGDPTVLATPTAPLDAAPEVLADGSPGSPAPATTPDDALPPMPFHPPVETPPPDSARCLRAAATLRAVIDARKRYPSLARRRGLSGTTVLTFGIGLDGTLVALTVERSSGSPLLDEAALAAVRDAAPFPVGGCSFTLPVQFRLAGPAADP